MAKTTKTAPQIQFLRFIGLDIEAASGALADFETRRGHRDPVGDAAQSHPGLGSFERSAFAPQKRAPRSR